MAGLPSILQRILETKRGEVVERSARPSHLGQRNLPLLAAGKPDSGLLGLAVDVQNHSQPPVATAGRRRYFPQIGGPVVHRCQGRDGPAPAMAAIIGNEPVAQHALGNPLQARVEGRAPSGTDAAYDGKVMCFFEVGDGKGTLLRFDYENPPKPPKPNRLWHVGKLFFNKSYYRIVPKGRGGTIEKRI